MKAILYVLTPVVLAIIVNAIIYIKGWQSSNEATNATTNNRNPLLPPGPIIGTIWIIIFAFLGYASYIANQTRQTTTSIFITIVIIWCLAYPFLTNGLNQSPGRILNTITLILAAILSIVSTASQMPQITYLLIPLFTWASYVNIADAIACSKLTV